MSTATRKTQAAEKAQTGRDAWTRLFSELTSAIRVELPDEPEPVMTEVALSRLFANLTVEIFGDLLAGQNGLSDVIQHGRLGL